MTTKQVDLPSGNKVIVTSVPSMAVLKVLQTVPEPKPPIVVRDNGREEENPADPEYNRKVKEYQERQGQLTNELYLANGVLRVVELAEGKYELEDDTWIEQLEIVGMTIRREPKLARKIDWLQYHVLGDGDLGEIISGIAIAGGGVTEALVKQAAESFRPNQNGTALTVVPTEAELRLGDTPAEPSGDSQ